MFTFQFQHNDAEQLILKYAEKKLREQMARLEREGVQLLNMGYTPQELHIVYRYQQKPYVGVIYEDL